jgi:transposase
MPIDRSAERERALELAAAGELTGPEIATAVGVSRGTVYRWLNPERGAEYARRAASRTRCPDCGDGKAVHARRCRRCKDRNRTPSPIRQEIQRRAKLGHDHFTIAMAVGLTPEQVKWRVQHYRDIGEL